MTTLSLVSGNCGRGKGDDSNFANEFLGSDSHRKLSRNLTTIRLKDPEGSRRSFRVSAGVKKGKKHDYPWPDDIDPNNKAPLNYLSYFKPLEDKPKPVTLAFEKPLVDLEKKIVEVQNMADDTGLDFTDQINALELKYQQWVELHGDRAGYDDPAIVTGIGSIEGRSYMFIGHQKGRNTKENIMRNFGMPTPHGYRKALRMMKYADHHGFPIVTFVDTPGAFADLKSEELGQGEAIAYNLRTMFGLKVPIITIVTGEGGSGGALAIACANKLLMLENAAFYVASPEACAAILWKSSQAAPKAAEKLRITAQEHYKLKIADGIIPEPLGGAHADPLWSSLRIKDAIITQMEELARMSTEELLEHRRLKFRSMGLTGVKEGAEVAPERKRNMKLSELNAPKFADIESEIEDLKKTILEAKVPWDPLTSQKLEKLEDDLEQEMTKAFISMGLIEQIESLNLELAKSANPDQALNEGLKEKADKLLHEFKKKLSRPGAYLGLKQKLQKLEIVSKLIEMKEKNEKVKSELNRKLSSDVKAKMEFLNTAREKLSEGNEIDEKLVQEVEVAKEKLEEVLKAANLQLLGTKKREKLTNVDNEFREEMAKVNKEIKEEIEKVIEEKGLGRKIEELKEEAIRDSTSEKVKKLEAEVKEVISDALKNSPLKERLESLRSKRSGEVLEEGNVPVNNGRW
ncbi:hypothetical protein ACP275_02G175200 [Erythranthe tilingii]